MTETEFLMLTAGAVATMPLAQRVHSRLALSRAKHPSLAGHARLARWVASKVPGYSYDEAKFFCADGAREDVVGRRKQGFERLAALFCETSSRSAAVTREVESAVSDLQFTGRYRVPFQFSEIVGKRLRTGNFFDAGSGVTVRDLDGNVFYDLSGSYGVNLFGVDFYKACIDEAVRQAVTLGPLLGIYHPAVAYNVRRLCEISGLDEVSFHMSGTEAVMQAVRLARYHTGKTRLVRFCGAYHGWWEGVQPGIGNPVTQRDTYTLRDMDRRTLEVLERRKDIACVLVNPLQALHPNRNAPSDGSLVDSGRSAGFDRQAYGAWLRQLRELCARRGIVLIFDEVFLGFRLAPGGAQAYFDVTADMVTYGKTLGGGLPVGVLCGRAELMRRFRDDRPADICFARGTFNSHPYVMTAMREFLSRLETAEVRSLYQDMDARWDGRAALLNARLAAEGLPVSVANLGTVWTVLYARPSRYNWMFQFYLRAEGLLLSWVGTGRLIFSLNYTESDFAAVCDRFVNAARAMQADAWWSGPESTNRDIRRSILGEMLRHAFLKN